MGPRFTPITDKILVAKSGAGMRIANSAWGQPTPGGEFRQNTTGSVAAVPVRLGREVCLHFTNVRRQGGRNIAWRHLAVGGMLPERRAPAVGHMSKPCVERQHGIWCPAG